MHTQANTEWLEEDGLALPKIEDRYIAFAIKEWGVSKVLEKMNHEVKKTCFELVFQFTKVNQTFISEVHTSILFFSIDLSFPISQHTNEVKADMQKVGGIVNMYEDDTHATYSIDLDEGSYANTMNEVVQMINEDHIPDIEEKLREVGITDYRCTLELCKSTV